MIKHDDAAVLYDALVGAATKRGIQLPEWGALSICGQQEFIRHIDGLTRQHTPQMPQRGEPIAFPGATTPAPQPSAKVLSPTELLADAKPAFDDAVQALTDTFNKRLQEKDAINQLRQGREVSAGYPRGVQSSVLQQVLANFRACGWKVETGHDVRDGNYLTFATSQTV